MRAVKLSPIIARAFRRFLTPSNAAHFTATQNCPIDFVRSLFYFIRRAREGTYEH